MKKVTMVFEKPELVIDIKHRAYVVGKSTTQRSEKPEEDDNWLIDIANKEDLTREPAGRFMTLAFMECYTICSALSPEVDGGDYMESDRYAEISKYIMKLQVKDEAKMHQVRYLHDLIHEYIVNRTLWLWAELASPDHAETFAVRATELKASIKSVASSLSDGGERPYFPQW